MLARSRPIYFAGRYQSQKVYLPTSVRENHYLLYQFANDYQGDWLTYLARSCQTHGIDNACVVFSDKAVKVRFADEFHLFETRANKSVLLTFAPDWLTGVGLGAKQPTCTDPVFSPGRQSP
ncbi:hypothetical protein ACFQMB_10010 [Pseudobowmanella zhangzhouensis]|uniref:hypothetical protein n=1 Tax=Pseudobowmanella zhangzhouensis TaxID=1537679 RepID=UPI00361822DC